MLRREQIERLKERYPAGTVVRLGQMEGEHQMPSGMEGKVIDVDCLLYTSPSPRD